jgi:hypothetical protein
VDKMIEVRYAGVVVGRTAIVRELDTRGLFLGITEPLPVGTPVVLHIAERAGGENVPGRVAAVSESQELAHAGMRVRFDDPQAASLFGTPVEAAPEPEPPYSPPAAEPLAAQAAEIGGSAAPDVAVPPQPSAPRRIVVDASAERAQESAAPQSKEGGEDEGADHSVATGGDSGRIPAPDPSAFSGGGGGGGKRGRRNRNR